MNVCRKIGFYKKNSVKIETQICLRKAMLLGRENDYVLKPLLRILPVMLFSVKTGVEESAC